MELTIGKIQQCRKVKETYYGEPILMERVMHIKSFMGFHTYAKIVEL